VDVQQAVVITVAAGSSFNCSTLPYVAVVMASYPLYMVSVVRK
jgi:hypothetical protein